ncbi:MAG: Holliday junction resolvase RuvX [Clostridia bacterium]|nr:Holliday junction resolvase RuvX [Clostridia bacterium]
MYPRTLAIDYGDRRIGLAVSDLLGITAQPVGYLTVNGDRDALRQLTGYVKEYQIQKFVLGLPKNMDGSEGSRVEKTREFARKLQEDFPEITVEYYDERMTTIVAQRALIGMNVRKKEGKKDMLSAAIILQGYLETHPNG